MAHDIPLRIGSELATALNRVDFFRLFKRLSEYHSRPLFFLSEVSSCDEELNFQNVHSVHNLPKHWLMTGPARVESGFGGILAQFKRYMAPFSIKFEERLFDLIGLEQLESAIVIPLHTPTSKRYCLALLGDNGHPDHEQLAAITLDAALIFQRYFEVILSLDSISALTEREIEILRWTSEGKTSGEIAIILGLSEHTVNTYVSGILRKLQVVNRAQMVAYAFRNGLIG